MLGRAAGRVTVVLPPAEMRVEERELLSDRVAELAYQGYGFFVVVLPPGGEGGSAGVVVPYRLFASSSGASYSTAYGVAARVIDLSDADPVELVELARLVVGLRGRVSVGGEGRLADWDDVGRLVAFYEDLVDRVLRRVAVQVQADVAASSGGESMTHYIGKAVAVKVLRSRARSLETEKEEEGIVVDVYLVTRDERRVAVEVETFYQRPLVVRRLVELTESRLKAGFNELWVIVPPLQALLLAGQLRLFMRWAGDRDYGGRVRVLTYVVRARGGRRGCAVALVDALRYAERRLRIV